MNDDFKGNRLPEFPVDEQTLELVWDAIHPWEKNPNWERSSLSDLLSMMDRLGGSDPEAVEQVHDDGSDGGPRVVSMRDQSYHDHNVIAALIAEVRRLRTTAVAIDSWPQWWCRSCGNRYAEHAAVDGCSCGGELQAVTLQLVAREAS